MQEGLLLSTDLVRSDLRTEYWREITRPFFETTQHPEDSKTTLEGSLTSRAIGSLLIGPTSFNQQQYRRDRRIVLQGGLDQYLVQLFITGMLEGDCDGQSISVGPGDICAFDLARNFESRVHEGATISIMLPRARVDKAAGGRSLHGVVLKKGTPVTRLLADFIVSLSDVSAQMERADALAMEEAAIDLLACGLARHVPDGATSDPALAQVLRRRVLDFIDANLTEPELGPTLLIRRFRVSRAHLYRVFAADGGVTKVVKEKRLDAACRELMHIGGPSRSIIEIAHGLGFSGGSQFLRAFRARFDMTPSDVRQQKGEPADPRLAHVQAHFAGYAQQLGLANRLG